jgi:hypothetical protein
MLTLKSLETEVIAILSSHRSSSNPSVPRVVGVTALLTYIQHRLSPNKPDLSREMLEEALDRLEAKGEILSAPRRSYCMARPFVVVGDDGLEDALFVGDRAYLTSAASSLETCIDSSTPAIRSRLQYDQAREKLKLTGVGILRLADLQQRLPLPSLPAAHKLHTPLAERSPFEISDPIDNYAPTLSLSQRDRWYSLSRGQSPKSPLFRLPDKSYLWLDNQVVFSIDHTTAILSMFYLDKEAGSPALVQWEETSGILDLTDIFLPVDYWKIVNSLSDEINGETRRRFVRSRYRDAIGATFLRLGIHL